MEERLKETIIEAQRCMYEWSIRRDDIFNFIKRDIGPLYYKAFMDYDFKADQSVLESVEKLVRGEYQLDIWFRRYKKIKEIFDSTTKK